MDKFCFYSEILVQASHIKDPALTRIAAEVRKSVLISHSTGRLIQRLCRFFKALTPFLREARSDENVLIYLIENKDALNKRLGEKQIEYLLQSFFPGGHDQLRAFIHEGFTRRGFSSFLASVEPLVEKIRWETPCNSPVML